MTLIFHNISAFTPCFDQINATFVNRLPKSTEYWHNNGYFKC